MPKWGGYYVEGSLTVYELTNPTKCEVCMRPAHYEVWDDREEGNVIHYFCEKHFLAFKERPIEDK